eukprot:10355338-Ditylum_brightwellii.AAC.1
MTTISQPNGIHPDDEYAEQFIWDADAENPNDNFPDNFIIGTQDEAGEKRKAANAPPTPSKISRKAV